MSENITPVPTPRPTTRERVERGAAWLNRTKPGWRDLIDLDTLNLAYGDSCVLGQVFADEADESDGMVSDGFDYAIEYLAPAQGTNWASGHGFDQSIDFTAGASLNYAPLTDAWKRYLNLMGGE